MQNSCSAPEEPLHRSAQSSKGCGVCELLNYDLQVLLSKSCVRVAAGVRSPEEQLTTLDLQDTESRQRISLMCGGCSVLVTCRVLARRGRRHIVLFQDRQPPVVLQNNTPTAIEVRTNIKERFGLTGRCSSKCRRHFASCQETRMEREGDQCTRQGWQ